MCLVFVLISKSTWLASGACSHLTVYNIQKLLFHINTRPDVQDRYGDDRQNLFDEYGLNEREKSILESSDIKELHVLGVHPQLLAPFASRNGIIWASYINALKEGDKIKETRGKV